MDLWVFWSIFWGSFALLFLYKFFKIILEIRKIREARENNLLKNLIDFSKDLEHEDPKNIDRTNENNKELQE